MLLSLINCQLLPGTKIFLTSLTTSTLSSSAQSVLCKSDHHCSAGITSVPSYLYNTIICYGIYDAMAPTSLSYFILNHCHLISCFLLFCFLKILSSFPLEVFVFCFLCSGCPLSILDIADCAYLSDLNSHVISEGTSLAILSQSTPPHPRHICLFISFMALAQHKIILFDVHFLSSLFVM